MNLLKTRRHQSKAVRDSCRDKPCALMLADQCSSTDTTVACHIPERGNGGMGTKPSDIFIADGCDACHAILDGRVKSNYTPEFLELTGLRANRKKIQFLLDSKFITMKGQK